jgi:hypothetical protein
MKIDKIQKKTNKQKEKKHRIIVIGDSHTRWCAAEIKSNLGEDFEVQGFINPGTGLNTIIAPAKRDIQLLSKQDVVVVWGGSKMWEKMKQNRVLIGFRVLLRQTY